MPEQLRKAYSMKLPPDLMAEVDAKAAADGTNRTRWVEQAIRTRLAQHAPPTPATAAWQGPPRPPRRALPSPAALNQVQPRWKGSAP